MPKKQNDETDKGAAKHVKVKVIAKYHGHNISANGTVNLTLKTQYGELTKTIQVLQMLNNDVSIKVRLAGLQAFALGSFRVKNVNFDHDGESTIRLSGIKDFVEIENLSKLPLNDDEVKEFETMFDAEIEEEEEND